MLDSLPPAYSSLEEHQKDDVFCEGSPKEGDRGEKFSSPKGNALLFSQKSEETTVGLSAPIEADTP
jgi:hypothetical protein